MTNIKSSANTSLWGWVVCLTASLFFFYEFIQMNMFNAINTQLMQEFSLTAAQLGKMSAVFFYANVLFLFPAGSILDRFSTRKVILISLASCVIGTYLFAKAYSLELATFCRFITGIGSAFCFLSSVRLASRWFPAKRMALITGLIVTMAMIGGMTAQTPLTLLVNAVGWRTALIFDAGLGVFILLLMAVIVTDHPPHAKKNLPETNTIPIPYWTGIRTAFLSLQNWSCGLYTCLMNIPLCLLGGLWGSLYLKNVHNLTSTQASYVTAMIFLGTIFGSPMMGWISDRISRRRTPMILGTLCSVLIMLCIMLVQSPSLQSLIVLFLLLGFTTSTQVLSYPTVAESNSSLITATCVSVVSISTIGGDAIFEPLFGRLMDLHWSGLMQDGIRIYLPNDFHFAMWLFPACILFALLAALLLRETYCRRTELHVDSKLSSSQAVLE